MHHVAHLLVAAVDRVAGGSHKVVDITCIAGRIVDLPGKLVDGRGKLFDRACLLGSTLRERLRAARDLLGTACDLLGRLVDLPEGVVERVDDLVPGSPDWCKVARVLHLHLGVEVAARNHPQLAADVVDISGERIHNRTQAVGQRTKLIA